MKKANTEKANTMSKVCGRRPRRGRGPGRAGLASVLLLIGAVLLASGCMDEESATERADRQAEAQGELTGSERELLDRMKDMAQGLGRKAQYWNRQRGGTDGDFSGLSWEDIVTETYSNESLEGDTYTNSDAEVTIAERNPLVLRMQPRGLDRVILVTVRTNGVEGARRSDPSYNEGVETEVLDS